MSAYLGSFVVAALTSKIGAVWLLRFWLIEIWLWAKTCGDERLQVIVRNSPPIRAFCPIVERVSITRRRAIIVALSKPHIARFFFARRGAFACEVVFRMISRQNSLQSFLDLMYATGSECLKKCAKNGLAAIPWITTVYRTIPCGRNSAVECQLPKLDVGGSNPLARFL